MNMRCLVITDNPPIRGPKDKAFGSYFRLRAFVNAISEICEHIEILHFANADVFDPVGENASTLIGEADWGTSVEISIAEKKRWRLWELPISPFSLKHDSRFSFLMGKTQLSMIKTRLSRQTDFIFAHRLSSILALIQIGKTQDLPPVFFDLDDVEHRYAYRRALNSPSLSKAIYRFLGIPKIMIAERRAMRSASKTFVCSEVDQSYLALMRMGTVTVIPNSIRIPKVKPPFCAKQTVLFLGNYMYEPNAEAAERLISRIWPLALQKNETARLIIAGDYPELIPSYRLQPLNVEFTGMVPDLGALYERSRIICCPIITGGGTRLKLIEAAAYAKPMIATSIGAEGLLFENDRQILIRNSDGEIAAACSRLLADDTECLQLGRRAYHKALSVYNVDVVTQRIKSELLATLKGPAQTQVRSNSRTKRVLPKRLSSHLYEIRSRSILARHPETRRLVTKNFKFPVEDDAAHIDAALKWLAWAIDASSDGGVVYGVNLRAFSLTGRLNIEPSYPETSGYILCTLVYGVRSRLPSLPSASLKKLSRFLLAQQTRSGGFPGPGGDRRVLSFDTGQVLTGLASYYKHIAADDQIRQAIEHAANWMYCQIEPDGGYSLASCYNGQRTYYVQATIGLLHAARYFGREDWLEAVVRNVNWAYRRHRGDGWFDTFSFEDQAPQNLHGIAYTIRGMIELGYRLGRPELIDCGRVAVDAMNRNYPDLPEPGGIPGYFANGFDRYLQTISPTGMAQIAICSYMLAEIVKDAKYRKFGNRLVSRIKAMQLQGFFETGLNGSLPGSWPVTGPYQHVYIPSWPLKFFLDALYIKSGAEPMAIEG